MIRPAACAKRLRGGEFADMILIASAELDKLIGEGKVKDRTDVSRTGIGACRQEGRAASRRVDPRGAQARAACRKVGRPKLDRPGEASLRVHVQRVF